MTTEVLDQDQSEFDGVVLRRRQSGSPQSGNPQSGSPHSGSPQSGSRELEDGATDDTVHDGSDNILLATLVKPGR